MSPSRFIELTDSEGNPVWMRADSIKTVTGKPDGTVVGGADVVWVTQSPQEVMDAVNTRLDRIEAWGKQPHGTEPITPTQGMGMDAATKALFPSGGVVAFYSPTFTWEDRGSHVIVRKMPPGFIRKDGEVEVHDCLLRTTGPKPDTNLPHPGFTPSSNP